MTTEDVIDREQAAARLRSAGLKVTEPRLAVYAAFGAGEHVDADEIFGRVSRVLAVTSRQAVYGVLAALSGAGLLRKIEPAGSPRSTRAGSATTTTTSCAPDAMPCTTSAA